MTEVRAALAAAAAELGPRHEAELLLAHVLGRDRTWLFAHATDALQDADLVAFQAQVARRAGGEPLAYITGRRGFWSLDLEVTPDTLIPRAETELLVELALERMARGAASQVADLGTGSGAVALALAVERSTAHILATDASAAALAVARRNATRLGVANVDFAQGDWCEALVGTTWDMVVSNPPYIGSADPHLGVGDLRHEPASALASGRDGLDAIGRIVGGAPPHLARGGWLLFEHGWNQGAAARQLLTDHGYVEVFTARDLESRERVSGGIHR